MEALIDNLANVLMACLTALVGVFKYQMNRQDQKIDAIEKDIQTVQLTLHKDFLTKDDHSKFEDKIYSKLDHIDSKMDKLLGLE